MLYSKKQCTKLLFLLLVSYRLSAAWRNFEIIYHNITCEILSKKVAKFDCFIKNSSRNLSTLSMFFVATEDIYFENLHFKASLLYGGNLQPLIDYNVNGCEFLKSITKSLLLQLVVGKLRENGVSNAPHNCPLKKGKEYYIKDFYIDVEKYPPYTPTLSFESSIDFHANGELIMRYELFGQMQTKKK